MLTSLPYNVSRIVARVLGAKARYVLYLWGKYLSRGESRTQSPYIRTHVQTDSESTVNNPRWSVFAEKVTNALLWMHILKFLPLSVAMSHSTLESFKRMRDWIQEKLFGTEYIQAINWSFPSIVIPMLDLITRMCLSECSLQM